MLIGLAQVGMGSDRYIVYHNTISDADAHRIIRTFQSIEVREPIEGNPMLEYVKEHKLDEDEMREHFKAMQLGIDRELKFDPHKLIERTRGRDHCNKKWAWAIPSPEAIECLRKYLDRGIYEIGAGSGYWARMVTGQWIHGSYFCYDTFESHAFTHFYHTIRTEPLVSMGAWETLFLCWPSYAEPWAAAALKEHMPKRVIYVGENGGCNADDEFHELLELNYDEIESVDIPQFQHIHDALWVYERKNDDWLLAEQTGREQVGLAGGASSEGSDPVA